MKHPSVQDVFENSSLPTQSAISRLSDSHGFLLGNSEINMDIDSATNNDCHHPLLVRLHQGFHGRIRELNTLKEELQKIQDGPSRAVWISGVSGVGKTSLVNEALANHPNSGHYFVMGKFDQTRQHCEPYSALIEALAELYDRIGHHDSLGLERKEDDKGQWGGLHMHQLTEIISSLSRISMKEVPHHQHTNQTDYNKAETSTTGGTVHSFVQFKHLCRTFLASTASADHPVVLFLDDLQWADEASLLVLDALLNDGDSRHVLLVGAYRDDELSSNSTLKELIVNTVRSASGLSSRSLDATVLDTSQDSFTKVLGSPEEIQDQKGVPHGIDSDRKQTKLLLSSSSTKHGGVVWSATMIKVRPLNSLALHMMVKSWTLRHNDEEETRNLSQVIWNKTHGNMYFVVQFMAMMVRKQLLVQMDADEKKDKPEEEVNASISSFGTFASAAGGWKDSATTCELSHLPGGGDTLLDRPYVWDIDLVQQLTNVSDNVMDHVVGNLRGLPTEIQAALAVAAFLGFNIHIDLLLCVLLHDHDQFGQGKDDLDTVPAILYDVSKVGWTRSELDRVLSVGRREGLIEQRYNYTPNDSREGRELNDVGGGSMAEYKFTHDRVPSALRALVPEGKERARLHLHIGRALLSNALLTEMSAEWLPPLAADHLNRGATHMERDDERMELVELNVRVAKASLAKCAFVPAAAYLKSATTLFEADYLWEHHYEVALDLFNTLAEANHHTGHFQASKEVIDSLLSRTKNVEDGLRSYLVRVEALGAIGETEKGRELAFAVMEELGVVFPKKVKKWHVVVEFVKIQLHFKGQDLRRYLFGMEPMTDPRKTAAMNILSNIAVHTFIDDSEKDTFALVGLRLMRLTVEHGINEWSPCGIATYAIVLAAVGKYKEAYEVGLLAMEVSDKLGKRSNEARHLLYLNQLVMHWQQPFAVGLIEFPRCYDLAMQHGDVDTGLCALIGYFTTALTVLPLDRLEPSFRQLVQQMYEFDHQTYLGFTVPMWQFTLNLLERSEDPLVLTGEAMNYELFHAMISNQNRVMAKLALDYLHLLLVAHCGNGRHDHERAVELLASLELQRKVVHTHCAAYLITFMMGFSYFRLLRDRQSYRGKRRRYLRLASRCTRRLGKWANKHGVIACRPFHVHLDAMRRCLHGLPSNQEKRYKSVKAIFENKSVPLCKEDKLICYLSMFCEDAAWWARVNGQLEDAKAFLVEAMAWSEEYGCMAALTRLGREYERLGGTVRKSRPYGLAIEFQPSTHRH